MKHSNRITAPVLNIPGFLTTRLLLRTLSHHLHQPRHPHWLARVSLRLEIQLSVLPAQTSLHLEQARLESQHSPRLEQLDFPLLLNQRLGLRRLASLTSQQSDHRQPARQISQLLDHQLSEKQRTHRLSAPRYLRAQVYQQRRRLSGL